MTSALAQGDFTIEDAWKVSAAALRRVAVDSRTRALLVARPDAMSLLEAASRRFVAGPVRQVALDRAAELHARNIRVSVEFMGEDTIALEEVELATGEFVALIGDLADLDLGASVSLNLSHVGLAVSKALATENCERILTAATSSGVEVILNMEGNAYTEDILQTYWRLGSRFSVVGITLQACLGRTSEDLARCLALPGRVRLVKGAYDELGSERHLRGHSVDERYLEFAAALLDSGHRCSIATHDPRLLEPLAERLGTDESSRVEFEMLFGVARHRMEILKDCGHAVRVYLPYGVEWFLYLCHRLAEHPPNLHLAVGEILAKVQRLASEEDGRA